MTVTFLGHSGFFLELPEADILFDYYQGDLPSPDPEKPLFVFASHAHGDHFTRRIFSLAQKTEKILYILSDDIPKNKVPGDLMTAGKVRFTGPDKDFRVMVPQAGPGGSGEPAGNTGTSVRVRTFLSTDAGVAFLLDVPDVPSGNGKSGTAGVFTGARIYHAGDLNDWHWDDVDQEWNDEQYRGYQDALKKIAACVSEDGHVPDAAFVPVDTRLGDGEFFWMGLDEYMKAVGARSIFPMHLFGDPAVIDRMRELPCAEAYRDRILGSGTPGEKFRSV
ncbi:MAG: MBL fold metallo-hydrolase [Stomatobaculum sp.]|nr:MBL fold metallo-hydrolase [Stomatobaculum sp.]